MILVIAVAVTVIFSTAVAQTWGDLELQRTLKLPCEAVTKRVLC